MSDISQWLGTCTKQHPKCRLADKTPLPSRVLEIDESPDHSLKLRLYRPAPNEMGRYICLSYCWGAEGSPVQLTKTTLSPFQHNINGETLPLTFQHAIHVTRKLGVKYLWIDSLCIVQDDSNDWSEQCPLMAEIYHNAYITLAASGASNPRAGLYFTSDDEWDRGREILSTNGRHSFRAFARTAVADMNSTWDREPLFKRAWAYQERMLSRRILYFTRREILWECNEQAACQCLHLQEKMSLKVTFANSTDVRDFTFRWTEIVAEYSRRELSHTTDKLPALAGIAKTMHSLRANDAYIAGLWRNTLCLDLLWHGIQKSKQATWQAPSWSWASTNCEVTFWIYEQNVQGFCPALSYVTHNCMPLHPTDEGCFGGLRSASLTVQGKLIPAIGKYPGNSLTIGKTHKHGSVLRDVLFWSGSTTEEFPVYILHVGDMCDGGHRTQSFYLYLRQVDVKLQTYERVGLFYEDERPSRYERLWRTIGTTRVTLV
ncbi:heterokaryon incompatibility protein-domain-containing protein [Aspergillus caelatus]|uniref:Heterokaryon incompatibility protein-domain-containing protein n=1 Tax=Aspergillus caelatus TaxID=61420 RepID=A0A5N7A4I8_9EURO|nr:heterokaryon incompatibility protein-domain-containing protein [Aspergillus caelatus]KAE8364764.1 heterokaryon incompatibility protein-domain-containing protein [Aspergillus caelatus]